MFGNWLFRMTTYAHLLQLVYKQKSRQMRQPLSDFFNLIFYKLGPLSILRPKVLFKTFQAF